MAPAETPATPLGHCKASAPATPGPALALPPAGAGATAAVDGSEASESGKPVFSGSLFQHGSVARGAHTKLIVPDDAVLVQGAGKGIDVFVQKALGFRGHPPEPMPLAGLRQNFGVASRSENKTLELATFGEFATKEGGASLRLVIQVPTGLAVVRHAEYSGVNSAATDWKGDKRSPTAGRVGYWYATPNPGSGWQRLALKDDAHRTAAQGGSPPARLGCP